MTVHVRLGGAMKYPHNNQSEVDRDVQGYYWLAVVPETVTKALAEAEAKLMTDGRTVDVGTRVPTGPKYVGDGEEAPNN